MNETAEAIDSAIREADRLRRTLSKDKSRQVRAMGERDLVKATALAWFNNHKPIVHRTLDDGRLSDIDGTYREILSSSARNSTRALYVSSLKNLVASLVDLRSDAVGRTSRATRSTSDAPPGFAPLIADRRMQDILARRWQECVICLNANAALAATVMMGGLLEALLLARVNREPDKAPIFKSSSAPRDHKTGRTLSLRDWTLAIT
jgi:hypothetical protein